MSVEERVRHQRNRGHLHRALLPWCISVTQRQLCWTAEAKRSHKRESTRTPGIFVTVTPSGTAESSPHILGLQGNGSSVFDYVDAVGIRDEVRYSTVWTWSRHQVQKPNNVASWNWYGPVQNKHTNLARMRFLCEKWWRIIPLPTLP